MTLGEKLQQLRKSKALSQEELADRLGVSRQSVSKWELNDSMPDIKKIIQLSDFYCVSTDYLLKETENPNNPSPKNSSEAKVLFIASTLAIVIGLFLAIGGWEETQRFECIALGIIIQSVGMAALFIGKAICPSAEVSLKVKITNFILLAFMPLSIVSHVVLGHPVGPYPITPPTILVFMILYAILLTLGIIFLIKNDKLKHL